MTKSKLQKILIKFVKDQFKNNVFNDKVSNVRVEKYDDDGQHDVNISFYIKGEVVSEIFNKTETKTFFVCHPNNKAGDDASFYLQSQGMGGFLWDNEHYHMISDPLNIVLNQHKFLAETINGDACWEVNHI